MINSRNILLFFTTAILCSLFSCIPQSKLVYFQGTIPQLADSSKYVLRIIPGDILSINIFTTNSEAYPYLSIPIDRSVSDNRSPYEKGYIVNDLGEVKLPLIGTVVLKNLSLPEATRLIETKFRDYMEDPVVTVKKLNFKVVVLGEVNKPGTYNVMNEKITLPEALGLAGDLTQFGDRQKLRLFREENHQIKDFAIDLTRADSLKAETYFLHPDDIIYVQPVKQRAFQNISPSVLVFSSIITTTIIALTFIIAVNNN